MGLRVDIPGERFRVVYHVEGTEEEAHAAARDICYEQTVEYPPDLVPTGYISNWIVGRTEDVRPAAVGGYEVVISYAAETAGTELTQLLNVVFGNTSLKPGIRVESLDLGPTIGDAYPGPRFGRDGLRELTGAHGRPLLCTALKPMGLGPDALAQLAYQLALGGIDLIKDDHGLTNQGFCPFTERVGRCAEAVERANRETGGKCVYLPNVTAPAAKVHARAEEARRLGAHGLLIAPGLVGFDAMHALAADSAIGLPILGHPALLGAFVVDPHHGMSHRALLGQVMRLAGADAVIFPSFGGRFSFTQAECQGIVGGTTAPMGHIKPILPVPAGGMRVDRVPELRAFYGDDVIFLIGGDLHRHGGSLVEGCRHFRSLVEAS